MNVLVTSGGTTENIDTVRRISNMSTGKLGSLIAERFADEPNVERVFYICSKTALKPQTGKLEALPDHILADLIPRYDISLLEADGSKGLPCKGWLENEPVVPDYCTHTVGVLTLRAIGHPANKAVVHRLPEFLSLTGLREGETITTKAMEAMICSSKGMFRKSIGQRYLVVNQVEDIADMNAAKTFLQTISIKYPNNFTRLIYGSALMDKWYEM